MTSDGFLGTVELDHSPIPDGCRRRLDEVRVKRDGEIWQINRNDADPYPSNPHAHNVESGLKLDLSTGALWFRATYTNRSIPRKDLLAIREQAAAKGIEVPPLAI